MLSSAVLPVLATTKTTTVSSSSSSSLRRRRQGHNATTVCCVVSFSKWHHVMRRPKSCQRMSNLRRRFVLARAAEKDDFDDDDASSKLAPSTPTSAHGEMLEYILSTEPDSFEGAMESVLEKLSDEIDATKALEENNNNNNNPKAKKDTTNTKDDAMSLTLYKRIEDIKKIDRRRAVEDAMYASIIHKVITTKTHEQSYLFSSSGTR